MTDINTAYKKQYMKLSNTKRPSKKIGVCKRCGEGKNWSHLEPALKVTFSLDIATLKDKQIRLK